MKEELCDVELQDIEDLLFKMEDSFNFKWQKHELLDISTFGELVDKIISKIELENVVDNTTQQAFYKLSEAISSALLIDKKTITPKTSLELILPKNQRLSRTKKIEKQLGFKINILRPPNWLIFTFSMTFILSFIMLFIYWKIGLSGMLFSIICSWISIKTGRILVLKTVGELAEKMTKENYVKSRRNQATFNKAEIEKILSDWFCQEFNLDKNELNRQSKFGLV
jgi:hypothetical protein